MSDAPSSTVLGGPSEVSGHVLLWSTEEAVK